MMAVLPLIADVVRGDISIFLATPLPAGSAAVGLLIAWLGVLGAVIGSFLNVVIYRIPLGMSVSFPGSHCPVCKHAIRWYDNVPVLGWLWLGGRCRDCRTAISPRYPLVELVVGLIFVGLAWLEIVHEGLNLPEPAAASDGAAAVLPADVVWLRYAYHLLFACTVLCVGLIDYDRRRVPVRFWGPVLLLGLALPLAWPALRPVPCVPSLETAAAALGWVRGLTDGACGLIAGLVFSWALQPGWRPRFQLKSPAASTLVLLLTGSFLGWQPVAWTMAGGLVLRGLSWLVARGRRTNIGFTQCAGAAAIAVLFSWRELARWEARFGWPIWLALGALGFAAGLLAELRRSQGAGERP